MSAGPSGHGSDPPTIFGGEESEGRGSSDAKHAGFGDRGAAWQRGEGFISVDKLPRVRDRAPDRGGGDRIGRRQIDLRLLRAHPPGKIPVGG